MLGEGGSEAAGDAEGAGCPHAASAVATIRSKAFRRITAP